uniref:Ig-like domain-containing protein n=1 Tax=Catagonus wagneri TaxID=51154 RepID=A0A8C3WPZ7_9CETA
MREAAALLLTWPPSPAQVWSFWEIRLIQAPVVVARVGSSVTMPCRASTSSVSYIHWYRQLEGQAPERLLYMALSQRDVQWDSVLRGDKVTAAKGRDGRSCTLSLMKLEKGDEGVYYCAFLIWVESLWSAYSKIFGAGTKLFVIDRNLATDMTPKPTVFLPSIAEINFHKAGTYLCLLEKFFPDVIQVYWEEKNGKSVLDSQQGNTIKTNDTYMKFSWLTVSERSMDKEHICFVKHEKNRGGSTQKILFPSINEGIIHPFPDDSGSRDSDMLSQRSPPFLFFLSFCLIWAAPTAYGGSQARGLTRAVAASLRHSHSNTGSKTHLQPTPQLTAMLDP